MAQNKFSPSTTDISSVDYDDMAQSNGTLYSDFYKVNSEELDAATGTKEYDYQHTDWSKWVGYYKQIPEFAAVVDKLASWTVGRGYTADEKTKKILEKIKGFGKDDFNTLLENFSRTMDIGGDAFAEIIRDKAGRLINLKPLGTESIKIITDAKGFIKRYEQTAKVDNEKNLIKFDTKDIFHLAWNRLADEVHGIPMGEKMQELIKMRNEAMQDQKVIFHRYAKPVQIISVDSDNETELTKFKNEYKTAYQKTEPILIPQGTVGEIKNMSIPQYSSLDPLNWLKYLVRVFTTGAGVPEVVHGWGEETTEASAKVIYLAWQQTIERRQRYFEAQLKLQLGIEINLEFPASLEEDLKEDNQKDSSMKGERKSELKPSKQKI